MIGATRLKGSREAPLLSFTIQKMHYRTQLENDRKLSARTIPWSPAQWWRHVRLRDLQAFNFTVELIVQCREYGFVTRSTAGTAV